MAVPYWHTREWWESGDPPNYRLAPKELQERHGEVTADTWGATRRKRGKAMFPDLAWRECLPGAHDQPADLTRPSIGPLEALSERVRELLKGRRMTVEALADACDVSPSKIRAAISSLQDAHVLIDRLGEDLALGQSIPVRPVRRIDHTAHVEEVWPIGVVSDTHYGSRYCREDVIDSLYDRFDAEGVRDVYIPGNWIDGEFAHNKHDLEVHGMDRQVDYFIDHLPRREGVTTHVLSGDDHEGWYVQREGINIGQHLQDRAARAGRDDIRDLGYLERMLTFEQEGGSGSIIVGHLGGGSSYAFSYASQKFVEALQGGEKPAVAILGHLHKYDVCYPREVTCVQPGCGQDQTPFMRKRKLQAHVGGCILHLRQNDLGIFTSTKTEFFPYFDRTFYDFKW